ncbi:MAG: hypothetical protein LBK75_08595 [Oscillospiraceae bacterium]|jgi:hypothetical protein|nr:hypothetical protein [Oscillospiraceae bacterium]
MNLQELSRCFELRQRLERDKEILLSLQEAAYPKATISDVPRQPGHRDRIGDLAVEIADMKERIRHLQGVIAAEEKAVSTFIETIGDERMRVILRLRFLRGLEWGAVANVLGGGNTEEGVKSACYRLLAAESCNAVTPRDAP